MGLKSALFKMKDVFEKDQKEVGNDKFIRNLELKNQLSLGSLDYYSNIFLMLKMKQPKDMNQTQNQSKKINRKWINCEIELMFQYIKDRQQEDLINITELLEEVAQLLNRGYQSVNYKYYTIVKEKEKKQEIGQKEYKFLTISQMDVPVISTELIQSTNVSELETEQLEPEKGLIDILSGLITNVQQLPGIQLNELLRSLYQLTSLALENQKGISSNGSLISKADIELLHEKLLQKEQQLIQERKRNEQLQAEVNRLAKEISAFSNLGDAAKIQNLKSYNQKLNSIIDKTGVALQVGS